MKKQHFGGLQKFQAFSPGLDQEPGLKGGWNRPPKNTFSPGWCYQLGLKGPDLYISTGSSSTFRSTIDLVVSAAPTRAAVVVYLRPASIVVSAAPAPPSSLSPAQWPSILRRTSSSHGSARPRGRLARLAAMHACMHP